MAKLRILAASDLHGDTSLTKKLSERAKKERADLIVLCGDITGFSETPGLLKPFKENNQHVVIIPGNWDDIATTDFLAKHYGLKNLHGYSLIHNNVGIFGAGGAEGPGPNRTSEKDLLTTLEKAHKDLEKTNITKKIMLTHMHPSGSNSECSGIAGSEAITEAVKRFKPDLLLHGHIHEAAGFEDKIGNTKVINVGREGRIIEI